MQLKTKLIVSVALLVLAVVLAVNLVSLVFAVRAQVRQLNVTASTLAQQIYNQASDELRQAYAGHRLEAGDSQSLHRFFANLGQSPAMQSLFSSAVGYQGSYAVRDVALVAPDGGIVAASSPDLVGQPAASRPPLSALVDGRAWRQLAIIFGPERIFEARLGLEVRQPGGALPLGTIRVGVDTVLLRAALVPAMRSLAWAGLLIVLSATLLAAALSGVALRPLSALSAQLDRLMAAAPGSTPPGLFVPASALGPPPAAAPAAAAHSAPSLLGRRDEFGVVAGKIERLGRAVEDVRQVYSTLQENVGHVLEGLPEGLLLFDENGICTMASAAAPALLDLPPGEIVGRSVTRLFAGPGALDTAVCEAVLQRRPMPACELARAGGVPLIAQLDPVRAAARQAGSLLTVREAASLRLLEDELELARRLAAIGRLTRGVAHEVKNPLNAITIHLELLRQKAGRGADGITPHLAVIRREIERLDRVVKTFLDFSRPVELRLARTDLSELVRGVAQLVGTAAAAAGIRVEVTAPPSGPEVWVDRDLVEQVLLNLVNNAVQALENPPPGLPSLVCLEVVNLAGAPAVRVRDSGPGIPAAHRDRIFDLYFTTRSQGSGIGLSVAARIMALHDGRLELEDSPNGASFLLHFARRSPQTAAVRTEAPVPTGTAG